MKNGGERYKEHRIETVCYIEEAGMRETDREERDGVLCRRERRGRRGKKSRGRERKRKRGGRRYNILKKRKTERKEGGIDDMWAERHGQRKIGRRQNLIMTNFT